MKSLNRIFFQGLLVVLPVSLSLYVFYWVLVKAEGLFAGILKYLVGPGFYLPGLGILFTLLAVFFVGLLVNNYITGKIILSVVARFEKIPFIKTVYGPLKDLMGLIGQSKSSQNLKSVVLVTWQDKKTIGLVTRESFAGLGLVPLDEHVAVYLPLSYMIGGVTVFVRKDQLQPLDISVDRALKLSITGWISQ